MENEEITAKEVEERWNNLTLPFTKLIDPIFEEILKKLDNQKETI